VKTGYEKNVYYYQKKIDVDMITADAVCVSDSVKSVENHRTIEDIKSKLDVIQTTQPRERESQFLGLNVYQGVNKVTEFEWDSKT